MLKSARLPVVCNGGDRDVLPGEDLQVSAVHGGVRVPNPFKSENGDVMDQILAR